MTELRRQLTLFVTEHNETIECIRAAFNPVQHALIPAHVTLCREDEILFIDQVRENLQSIRLVKPICLRFGPIERFADGKGVLMPSRGKNTAFHRLRKHILQGIINQPRAHQPHLTMMHPRNSTCTDALFDQLTSHALPTQLNFDTIHLIEQKDGGAWRIVNEYKITTGKNGH